MNVRKEIEQFASDDNKPILLGLFNKYHMQSQWNFVATCTFQNYGKLSYQANRIWSPTEEGKILYEHLIQTSRKNNIELPVYNNHQQC